MKIKLAKNWSEPFLYHNQDGYFIGRKKEIESLYSIIKWNSYSSTLISSVKGVGKTSFVHKTISELEGQKEKKKKELSILPIFLGMNHILNNRNNKEDSLNKEFLKALIQAAHFKLNPKYKEERYEDKEIYNLYRESIGDFQKESAQLSSRRKESKIGLTNPLLLVFLAFYVLTLILGIVISDEIVRIVLALIQLFIGTVSFSYINTKTEEIEETTKSKQKNDTEYLQIQFQQWTQSQQEKKKKLIFIIDELDTIKKDTNNNNEALKPLEIIKSFKNLFSNSLAHYIFIAGTEIYDKTDEDREKGEESYCPTLFTHRIFLPLPASIELKEYLYEIFDVGKNDLAHELLDEADDLCSYLLYRAGNDFFELKRVLFDLIEYQDDMPYLDTDQISKEDEDYKTIIKTYNYADYWVKKSTRKLKKYWKENFDLSRDIFSFFNKTFVKEFNEKQLTNNQQLLVSTLKRGNLIKETTKDAEGYATYIWTREINIPNEDSLSEDEKDFLKTFSEMINLANVIDKLPTEYKDPQFYTKNFNNVKEGHDGMYATDLNLFAYYERYMNLESRLNNISTRSEVGLDESKGALEEIQNILNNINNTRFKTFNKILKETFNENFEIGERAPENQEAIDAEGNIDQQILTGLPSLLQFVKTNLLFRISSVSRSKNIFFVKGFETSNDSENELEEILSNNKNILFINLTNGLKYTANNLSFTRPKRKGTGNVKIQISNFKMIELKHIKDFGKVLKIVYTFFYS